MVDVQVIGRRKAHSLQGWRRAVHRWFHVALAGACLFGLIASTLVGRVVTNKLTGAALASESAGDAVTSLLMLGTGAIATIVAHGSRRTSWRGGIAMCALAVAAFVAAFSSGFDGMMRGILSWDNLVRTHISAQTVLWPSTAVRLVSFACIMSGPTSLAVHAASWWREDAACRQEGVGVSQQPPTETVPPRSSEA